VEGRPDETQVAARPASAVPEHLPGLHTQVFRALTDAVVVTDLHGRVIECNPAAEELLGVPREAMLGHRPDQLGDSWLGSVPSEVVRESLRVAGSWRGDVPLEGVEGGIGALFIFPVHDDDQDLIGFAGITRDVTGERGAVDELSRAEHRWRSMLDVAPIGLALVSLEGVFERVNAAMCRIVGYSAEELQRLTFQEVTHPDDLAADLALLAQLLAGDVDHYTLEKRYLHKRGHVVWVQLSVGLIRDGSGRPEQFVVAIENVTERRAAAERLSSIIAGASDAFVAISATGYVTEWNAAAVRLFGWSRSEALGRPLTALIVPPEHRQSHQDGLHRLRSGHAGRILGRPVELTARTKTDDRVTVELTVWRADDDHTEFYAFVRDTTERARASRRQAAIAAAQLAIADVELSPQKVMREICEHARALTRADAACLEVREGDEMVYRAVTGTAAPHLGLRLSIRGSLSGQAVLTGQPLVCHDSERDDRVDVEACRRAGARSLVVVPLRRGTTVHGVVKVFSGEPNRFTDEDTSTLSLLAAPFGSALANAWQLEATSQQALTDQVTGLGNRAHALRELERAILRQNRRGSGLLALMFIDLDRFKQVNDVLGHAAGDQVLVAVADKLRGATRTTDTAARYGGDEFLVICEDVSSTADVVALAERLVASIAGRYAVTPGSDETAEIGTSIGIAVTAGSVTATDLLHAADAAMYDAKQAGGTGHVIRHLDRVTG
jgi:diguanylate cyclase (GGDEF)-like protein/PAS domain S-box-containing protein